MFVKSMKVIAAAGLAVLVAAPPVASADDDPADPPAVNQQWGPGNPEYDFCASMRTPWPDCEVYGNGSPGFVGAPTTEENPNHAESGGY